MCSSLCGARSNDATVFVLVAAAAVACAADVTSTATPDDVTTTADDVCWLGVTFPAGFMVSCVIKPAMLLRWGHGWSAVGGGASGAGITAVVACVGTAASDDNVVVLEGTDAAPTDVVGMLPMSIPILLLLSL